jgi:hypothetical protein
MNVARLRLFKGADFSGEPPGSAQAGRSPAKAATPNRQYGAPAAPLWPSPLVHRRTANELPFLGGRPDDRAGHRRCQSLRALVGVLACAAGMGLLAVRRGRRGRHPSPHVTARAAESAHIVHKWARLDSVASAAGERGTAPTLGWGYGAWGRAKSALHPVVRKRLAHAERDDPASDQPAGEGGLGQDLHAVRVAQEPLEVDEDARTDGRDLLEPCEVEDGDP